ncbi:MAG: FkbM family methyltransferase [Christensenellaceae bacterium]|nr:FkbM family methyltransferase [Christensenellaceae bacterium]
MKSEELRKQLVARLDESTEEMNFTVNGDKDIDRQICAKIEATDWDEIKKNNNKTYRTAGAITMRTDEKQIDNAVIFDTHKEALERMRMNKDITVLMPEHTRFSFVKRVIKKLMKVSTRYQQEYNNAAIDVIEALLIRLKEAEKRNAENRLLIEEHKQIIFEQADLVGKQGLRLFEQEQLVDKMYDRLKYFEEALDKINDAGIDILTNRDPVDWGRKLTAQAGEDGIMLFVLDVLHIPYCDCTYLDLGANHPRFFSNTNYLYMRGAKGVLVEANPELIPNLKFYRHGDVILNKLITDKSGDVMDFYIMNGDGLSTPDYEAAQSFIRENPELKITRKVQVETISVNDIMAEYFTEPPTIVNLDIEGMEMEVLKSMDFEKYRPLMMVIEMIPYKNSLVVGIKNHEILDFMESVGYVEYAFSGINSIFIDKKRVEEIQG